MPADGDGRPDDLEILTDDERRAWRIDMRKADFVIRKNRKIADSTYEMILSCTDGDHGITRPGQFVNIKIDGFFLRRPISVCDWDERDITMIYKTVGAGTEAMSAMAEGEKLDVLTPLGNGFDTEADIGDAPVLIGGGAGVPPMYGLCRTLISRGKEPIVILGFNRADESFYTDKFKALGVKTVVTTADGSLGMKGFVTDALKTIDGTYLFACGPEAMLRAIDGAASEDTGGQFSFEERMGCGFGACMGCSCETKYGYKRICKEGPVLERGEVIW